MKKALVCLGIDKGEGFFIDRETRDVVKAVIKYCATHFDKKFNEIPLDTM